MYGKLTTDLNRNSFSLCKFICSKVNYPLFKHHNITQISKTNKKQEGRRLFQSFTKWVLFSFVPLFEFNPIHCSVPWVNSLIGFMAQWPTIVRLLHPQWGEVSFGGAFDFYVFFLLALIFDGQTISHSLLAQFLAVKIFKSH